MIMIISTYSDADAILGGTVGEVRLGGARHADEELHLSNETITV